MVGCSLLFPLQPQTQVKAYTFFLLIIQGAPRPVVFTCWLIKGLAGLQSCGIRGSKVQAQSAVQANSQVVVINQMVNFVKGGEYRRIPDSSAGETKGSNDFGTGWDQSHGRDHGWGRVFLPWEKQEISVGIHRWAQGWRLSLNGKLIQWFSLVTLQSLFVQVFPVSHGMQSSQCYFQQISLMVMGLQFTIVQYLGGTPLSMYIQQWHASVKAQFHNPT